MGYFDGLTAASFKKDAQGRELFFLWGRFGGGRVIPSEAEGADVRRYLKAYYIGVLIGIVVMVLVSGESFQPRWFLMMGLFIALALGALLPLWRRTRQWQASDERLTYSESMAASAKAHSAASLWVLVVLGVLLVIGGLLVLIFTDGTLLGILGLVLFVPCIAIFLYMLRVRQRG